MTDLTNLIFNDADKAREHLEKLRWPEGPVCPHCGARDQLVARVEARTPVSRKAPMLEASAPSFEVPQGCAQRNQGRPLHFCLCSRPDSSAFWAHPLFIFTED